MIPLTLFYVIWSWILAWIQRKGNADGWWVCTVSKQGKWALLPSPIQPLSSNLTALFSSDSFAKKGSFFYISDLNMWRFLMHSIYFSSHLAPFLESKQAFFPTQPIINKTGDLICFRDFSWVHYCSRQISLAEKPIYKFSLSYILPSFSIPSLMWAFSLLSSFFSPSSSFPSSFSSSSSILPFLPPSLMLHNK